MKKTIVTLVLVFALVAPVYAFSPANILEQFKSFFGAAETSIEETYQKAPTELQELEQEPFLIPETLIEVPDEIPTIPEEPSVPGTPILIEEELFEVPTEPTIPETPILIEEEPESPLGEEPIEVTESEVDQFIIVPVNGECPEDYIISEDNKRCIKLAPPSPIPEVPYEEDISPVESTEEQGYVILPKDGKCPDGYTLSGDGKICVKPPVPTIFIAPKESFKEVIFNPGENVIIKDKNINKEAVVAPEEGFKAIISIEFEGEKQAVESQNVTIQSGIEPGRITLSVGQIFASTKEPIEIRENRIYVGRQEITVMPDKASEIAVEELESLITEVELKNIGSQEVPRVVYEATTVQEVSILGLFRVGMTIRTEIDAQTGEASEVKRPWWSFLVR